MKAILDDAPNARVETIRDRILEEGEVTAARRRTARSATSPLLAPARELLERRETIGPDSERDLVFPTCPWDNPFVPR